MKSRAPDHAEVFSCLTATRFDVEVMRAWYHTQAFARHTHPYFTLGIIRRGLGTLWAAGVTKTFRRGDILFIPPEEVHTGGTDARGGVLSYTALHIPADLVAIAGDTQPSAVPAKGFGITILRDPALATELRRIDAAVEAGTGAAAVESGITSAIDLFVRRYARKPLTEGRRGRGIPQFVHDVRIAIEDCFADNSRTSLTSLAASAGVSVFHLVREFKRASGLSPHQYLIQTRVRRAAEMLTRGARISDAAATVGFVDQSHLTTHFRKHVGLTPASWQRSIRG